MFLRLLRLAARSFVRLHYPSWLNELKAARSQGRSFVYNRTATGLTRGFARTFGRTELIDVSKVRPGEVFVVELLPISHKDQIKQFKKADRKARRAARQERRAAGRGLTGRILRPGSGRERHSA